MAAQPTLAKAWIGLVPTLDGSTKQIEKELGDVDADKPGKKVGGKFGAAIGIGLLAAGALIAKGLSGAVDEASNLTESLNAVQVTYGENAAGVQELGKAAATQMGLSNSAFNGLAVQFSAFTKTIAGDGGDVVGTLESITGRASDFASVMNLEVADAATLFQSGLAGETEPLRKYGIDLSAASVQAYALANGIGDGTSALTEAEKVQARYGSLMEQTAANQVDFINTSDGLANSQRILGANMDNLKAVIGSALLPALAGLTGAIIPMVTFLAEHQWVLIAIGSVVGVALVGAFIAWTATIWAANAALLASPITWIVVGILALAAAIIWAYNNVSWFKTGIDAMGAAFVWLWDNILKPYIEKFAVIWTWLWENIFKPVVNAIVAYVKMFGEVWSWLWTNAIKPAIDGIVGGIGWMKDKTSENFDKFKSVISGAVDFVTERFQALLDFFEEAPGKIGGFFSGIGDTIKQKFKSAFNGIAGFWNDSVGKLSFTIPDIIGVPNRGETFNFPKIPYLATGGTALGSGWSMVGEQGPELLHMQRGASVVPLARAGEFGPQVGKGDGPTRLHPDDIQALGAVMLAGANVAAAKRIENIERTLGQMRRQAVA